MWPQTFMDAPLHEVHQRIQSGCAELVHLLEIVPGIEQRMGVNIFLPPGIEVVEQRVDACGLNVGPLPPVVRDIEHRVRRTSFLRADAHEVLERVLMSQIGVALEIERRRKQRMWVERLGAGRCQVMHERIRVRLGQAWPLLQVVQDVEQRVRRCRPESTVGQEVRERRRVQQRVGRPLFNVMASIEEGMGTER